jgi:hypothetical protein
MRHAGSAATARQQWTTSNFIRREQDVNVLLAWDVLSASERGFEFRPFNLDLYGALSTSAKQAFHQLAKRHSEASCITAATCKRLALQTICVARQWRCGLRTPG